MRGPRLPALLTRKRRRRRDTSESTPIAPPAPRLETVGVALGGGGARGLAHIAIFEALDELGVKPVAIAGTSIGALVGAAYASGMSGKEMRRYMLSLAHNRPEMIRRIIAARVGGLTSIFQATFGNPMLVDAAKFCALFLPESIPDDFAALTMPLTVVATDLYARAEAPFQQGALRPALAASMAVPGLIRPIELGGRVFVDGGAVNPLPFEHVRGKADVTIAVDISGPPEGRYGIPDPFETVFATLQVMGSTIVAEKLRHWTPEIMVRPNVRSFRLLDFFHASAVLRAAEPAKDELKRKLEAMLAA